MSSSTLKERTKPTALKYRYIVILKALNIHLILKTFMTIGGVRSIKRRTYSPYKPTVQRYAHTDFTLSEAFVLHGRFFCAHLNPTTLPHHDHLPIAHAYCWFVHDVTAAMLVVKSKSISLPLEINSILM